MPGSGLGDMNGWGKWLSPQFQKRDQIPGSPQVLLPAPHSGQYPKNKLGDGGANRARCAEECGSNSGNDKDGVITPLCNMNSHRQVTRGRGTPEITTNLPDASEPGP